MAFHEVKAAFAQTFAVARTHPRLPLTTDDCHFMRRNFSCSALRRIHLSLSRSPAVRDLRGGGGKQATTNGSWPSSIRRWRCFIMAFSGRVPIRTRSPRPGENGPRPAQFSIWFFRRGFYFDDRGPVLFGSAGAGLFRRQPAGRPRLAIVPPGEAEVFIDETKDGDVGLRRRGSHQYLGSFARNWLIPLGFHPFSFSLGRHTPRLRCGKVIVQRRSWTIAADELAPGDYTGISRHLVVAVERLRAARDLPRHVFIRRPKPPFAAAERKGATRTPSRFTSTSRVTSSWKFSIAGS